MRLGFDPMDRQKRQFDEAVAFTQKQLGPAAVKRDASVWSKLDTSLPSHAMQKSQEPLRKYFHENVIGKLPASKTPLNPRTRLLYETPKWKGYEVVLDLYEDVICYGILLVPKDIKAGEKRPVVVCQHGLEGRPTDVVQSEEEDAVLQLLRRPARRPRLHRLRPAEPVHLQEPVPPTRPQGQPARPIALLVHRRPARADPRLARNAAVRRSRPHRLLRPLLRRQGRDAHPGRSLTATACRSAPATSTSGSGRTSISTGPAATCSPASTRCSSSTSATRSTTPRWPP